MGIREDSIKMIKMKKVEIVGQSPIRIVFITDKNTVMIQKKSGRSILTCSCENHARFCNSNALCKHKLSALFYWMMQGIKDGN